MYIPSQVCLIWYKVITENYTNLLFYCIFTLTEEAEPEESEEPFVAPSGLTIPPDVELVSAETLKLLLTRDVTVQSSHVLELQVE